MSSQRWPWIALAACVALAGLLLTLHSATPRSEVSPPPSTATEAIEASDIPPGKAKATFAAGCFWCTEAVFQRLKGVEAVVSGYSGGTTVNPSYEEVCAETTGHAEAIEVTYDPAVVSYSALLEVFWKTHDPTTPNRQGNDHGARYRSAIFYHNEEQRRTAESYKTKLAAAGFFEGEIVTQIVPRKAFYRAEDYHQNYFNENESKGYCRFIIAPKLDKLRRVFSDRVKE